MPNLAISQLPVAPAGALTDLVPVVQGGVTSQSTTQKILQAPGGAGVMPVVPTATLLATNVQAGLAELDAKKTSLSALVLPSGSSLVGWIQAGAGAVLRLVQDKLRELTSVKDFGGVGDGVTDDTAARDAANAAALFPLVPAGTFSVTTYKPWSTWGAGNFTFNGITVPAAPFPMRNHHLRESLNKLMVGHSPGTSFTAVLGDSISEGYQTPIYGNHWPSLLRNYMQAQKIDNSLDVVTNFGDPARYVLALTGGSVGTAGPINSSFIMTVGATIGFSGDYKFVEVFFQRVAGGGSLEFRKNGILIKTINCAGTTLNDVLTFPSTSFAAGYATYEIKCITATVEVTGVWRANQAADSGVPYFARCAHTAWATDDFTTARIQSAVRMADPNATGNGTFIIALGTNDMVNAAKAKDIPTFKSNLERMFSTIADNCAKAQIIYIMPPRFNETIWPLIIANTTWYDYQAAAWEVCSYMGAHWIDIDSLMLLERGFLSDGLHPSVAGHQLYAQFVSDQLQKLQPRMVRPTQIYGARVRGLGVRAEGSSQFTTGAGVEINYTGGQGYLRATDKDLALNKKLVINDVGGDVAIGGTNSTITLGSTGSQINIGSDSTMTPTIYAPSTTTATAGAGAAIPATVAGYITINHNGVARKIATYLP